MDQTHSYNGSLTAEQFLFYEISIAGTMMKADELANTLQVCLDSEAKEDAVYKALGVE